VFIQFFQASVVDGLLKFDEHVFRILRDG